jgi:branched-chain amino acid transport system substrate-binding protein
MSSVTLALQPVVEDAGVLLLNAASSNPKITYGADAGGFKWTFRNNPTDENRALIVIQYAAEKKGFTKFAVLSVDTDYGRAAVEFTKKYLPRFKGEIPTEDYYKEGEVDFRSVLAKIRNSGAHSTRRGRKRARHCRPSRSLNVRVQAPAVRCETR